MAEHHKFGIRSKNKLDSCHRTLQKLAASALIMTPYDFSIIHGWRNEEMQNMMVESGVSRTPWPTSKHNHVDEAMGSPCSLAVDFAPWINGSIPWNETHIFAVIAGSFFAAAELIEVKIRWGGDWDSDGLTTDQTLLDYGHIELVNF